MSNVSYLLCSKGQRLLRTGNDEQQGPLGRKRKRKFKEKSVAIMRSTSNEFRGGLFKNNKLKLKIKIKKKKN